MQKYIRNSHENYYNHTGELVVGKRKNLISTDQPVVNVTPFFLCCVQTGLNQLFIKVCSGRLI